MVGGTAPTGAIVRFVLAIAWLWSTRATGQ
jgi:hypothetical protein